MKTPMKTLLCLFFLLFLGSTLSAQSNEFGRKGSILVETGYFLIPGLTSGTGAFILIDEGTTLTNLAFDGGYFISNDFALKFGFGLISAGESITSFAAGGKYYIGGVAPLELTGGLLSAGGDSQFIGNASIGYGIQLAPNINLEPSIGGVFGEDSFNTKIGLRFALFL